MANPCFKILYFSRVLWILVLSISTLGQSAAEKKLQTKTPLTEETKIAEADALEKEQRRILAISLVTSLAEEARSSRDPTLRPRVLARAADTLWDADNGAARTLFQRAWEAAEKGDAEEVTIKTKDNPPPMVIGLRRISGRDLRSEVLRLAARRDRALGDEFLARLKDQTEREAKEADKNAKTQRYGDGWSTSDIDLKRLHVARMLLDDGEIERALELAAPALGQVNANSIGFLSVLRTKKPDVADQRFASLLAFSEFDPSSDANTVSGLSSYAFTPGFYVTFSSEGNARWTEPDSLVIAPPNLPAGLRSTFIKVAGFVLLRPLPPPSQDFTSAGRTGKYMVIKRLLPIFDQYAPDTASALRTQLSALMEEQLKRPYGNENSLLTRGLQSEQTAGNVLEKMQDRLDRATTSQQRDSIYAEAAVTLADQGDTRAADLADRIDDRDRREKARQYIDFQFVQHALRKKDAAAAIRLAKAGHLNHTLRSWAYTQAARLIIDSEKERAVELLEEAANEARRLDQHSSDRARALIGVATQFMIADPVRAWEISGEAVKAANSDEKFTGEDSQLTFGLLPIGGGIKVFSVNADGTRLADLFPSLTRDNLYRSIDLAKSFKSEAPRVNAVLAIARTVLGKQLSKNTQ